MSYLKASQFLNAVARQYQHEKETYSKRDINKKINEIKYLSSQKKVSRATLRKEIVLLEQKMQSILDVERAVLSQKKKESAKEKMLKQQIATLRQKLSLTGNEDVQKKVARMSHLIGDLAAQTTTEQEIKNMPQTSALTVGVKTSLKNSPLQGAGDMVPQTDGARTANPGTANLIVDEDTFSRVAHLQDRLTALKQELALTKALGKDGNVDALEQGIFLIETKLSDLYRKYPQLLQAGESSPMTALGTGKHTLLFNLSSPQRKELTAEEVEFEKELPLPPPPKMRVPKPPVPKL